MLGWRLSQNKRKVTNLSQLNIGRRKINIEKQIKIKIIEKERKENETMTLIEGDSETKKSDDVKF